MRTRNLVLLFALLGSAACVATAGGGDSPERQRAVAAEFFRAISAADVTALDTLYADDFEIWTAGSMPFSGTSKKAQALEGMAMIGSMFPEGLEFTVLATTVEGERVAVEAVSKGRHVSGELYNNQYHFLLIIRDGKLHALKEYMDTQHAQAVLVDSMASQAPSK